MYIKRSDIWTLSLKLRQPVEQTKYPRVQAAPHYPTTPDFTLILISEKIRDIKLKTNYVLINAKSIPVAKHGRRLRPLSGQALLIENS